MQVIDGHEAEILDWLERVHHVEVVESPRKVLGIIDDELRLRGCVVLIRREPTTADLHIYGTVSQDVAKAVFRYAFGDAGQYRLEARIDARKKRIRRAARKCGWKFEGVTRGYYGPGRDAHLYAMTADDCRWLKREVADNGQVA